MAQDEGKAPRIVVDKIINGWLISYQLDAVHEVVTAITESKSVADNLLTQLNTNPNGLYKMEKTKIFVIEGQVYGRANLVEPSPEQLREDSRREARKELRQRAIALGLTEEELDELKKD